MEAKPQNGPSISEIHWVLNLSEVMKGKELHSLKPEIFWSEDQPLTLGTRDFLINIFRGKVKQLDVS
jgi:hypothetical protein